MSVKRSTPRAAGTSDTFAVGDRVRKVEGRRDLGREGVVTAVSPQSIGGDDLLAIDGEWMAYDRQLEKVQTS